METPQGPRRDHNFGRPRHHNSRPRTHKTSTQKHRQKAVSAKTKGTHAAKPVRIRQHLVLTSKSIAANCFSSLLPASNIDPRACSSH
eukprot:1609047-Rhodomonas_salina.1